MKKWFIISVLLSFALLVLIWFVGRSYLQNYVLKMINQKMSVSCDFSAMKINPLTQTLALKDLSIEVTDPLIKQVVLQDFKAKISLRALLNKSIEVKSIEMKQGKIVLQDLVKLVNFFKSQEIKNKVKQSGTKPVEQIATTFESSLELRVESVHVEDITIYSGEHKAVFIDQMELQNILWADRLSRVTVNAFIGDDRGTPLFIDAKFIYTPEKFKLVEIKQILTDFPIESVKPFWGESLRIDGTIDFITSTPSPNELAIEARLKNVKPTQSVGSEKLQQVFLLNPNLTCHIRIRDLDRTPYVQVTVPELSVQDNLILKGINIQGPLDVRKAVPHIDRIDIDDFSYTYIKQPEAFEQKSELETFKKKVRQGFFKKDKVPSSLHRLKLNIEKLNVKHGTVRYLDQSDENIKRIDLEQVKLLAQDIHLNQDKYAHFSLTAVLARQGDVSVEGEVIPRLKPLNLRFFTEVQDVDIMRFESFLPKQLKGKVAKGILDLQSRGKIVNDYVNAENKLLIQQLEFEQGIQVFGFLTVSIRQYLKDHNDRFTVPFTLNGHLRDPKFSVPSALIDIVFRSLLNELKDFLQQDHEEKAKAVDVHKDVLGHAAQLLPALLSQSSQGGAADQAKEELKSIGKGLESQLKQILLG